MAVLHRKEEKIQAVLGRLPKKYSPDDFVAMFIKLYSKDWGKIKSAYIKASQDKEPGTVIHMPKPDLYLKQVLEIFLSQKPVAPVEIPKEEIVESKPAASKTVKTKVTEKAAEEKKPADKAVKSKTTVKKAEVEATASIIKKTKTEETPVTKTAKSKVSVKKLDLDEPVAPLKKARAVAKKKVD